MYAVFLFTLNGFKSVEPRTLRKNAKISVSQMFLAQIQNRVPSKSAPLKAAYHKALLYYKRSRLKNMLKKLTLDFL